MDTSGYDVKEKIAKDVTDRPLVSIVVPVYNESGTVSDAIDRVRKAADLMGTSYEIIAVDDGSKDDTRARLKEARNIIIIEHDSNEGYGASLKAGIGAARGETLVIVDGDGTYPYEKIPELVKYVARYDMVVAARTGKHTHIPLIRRFAKGILTILANYLSGKKIPDLNSGMRVIRRAAIVPFMNILPSGFSFTTTVTLAFLTSGRTVKYEPIEYHHRKRRSKFRPVKDTLGMFALIIRTILYFNPLKIFVPLSMIFIIMGGCVFIWSFMFAPKIHDVTTLLFVMTGIQTLVIGLLADLIDRRTR